MTVFYYHTVQSAENLKLENPKAVGFPPKGQGNVVDNHGRVTMINEEILSDSQYHGLKGWPPLDHQSTDDSKTTICPNFSTTC